MTDGASPVFDHRQPGASASMWAPLISAAPPVGAPSADDHLVVLVAHPDDETLGAGGLLHTADRLGARTTVIVASDGEASHPRSRTHTSAELAALRRRELAAAVEVLAPRAELREPGLPDGKLADHTSELTAVLGDVARPTQVVTTWAYDGHPDHAACAAVGAAVAADAGARHWQSPLWAWRWGRPDGMSGRHLSERHHLVSFRLDDAARAAKDAALACYTSQHQPLSTQPGDEAILDDAMLQHFSGRIEPYLLSTTSTEYFDGLYAQSPDPWGLAGRFYERRKRDIVLSVLPRQRFRRAFEPGCATGLLTERLAGRCDKVVAWDAAAAAVRQTTVRLADDPHVVVSSGVIPESWPDGTFDLIVLSEVGYYCRDLAALVARIESSLDSDGVVVACHWRHRAALHPHTAEEVHAALDAALPRIVTHVELDFRLDVWSREGRSVAVEEGIVS